MDFYVWLSDVTLTEETIPPDSKFEVPTTVWTAEFLGKRRSTRNGNGPMLSLSRFGETADEALANLTNALKDMGIELKS